MIIKRDPKTLPPSTRDILVLTKEGKTLFGDTDRDGDHILSQSFNWCTLRGDVTAWAPAEWTDGPTTDAARDEPVVDPGTMKKSVTNRGFALVEFTDRNGQACTLQKSSLADEDCVWLGCKPNRMHLTEETARALVLEIADIFDDPDWTEEVSGRAADRAWEVSNRHADERDALGRERDDAISRAEKAEAYCAELVERATIAEDNANVALTHSVQLKRERDRAIEERDALGLQLAALRADNARMARALTTISETRIAKSLPPVVFERIENESNVYMRKVASDALTHGVDVTKEGE
jgi:hypothetical protein